MHRTLKAATAQPPASNLRMQQQAFDAFQREYNGERPHEALQMKTPSECYEASSRRYPSRLAEPEYSAEWEVRRVRECGRMRWWSGSIFVGKALVGEQVGLEPQAEGIWRVWFYGYPIGLLNERKGKIEKLARGAEPESKQPPTRVVPEASALERA